MFYPYFICIIQIYTILLQWNCRGFKGNYNEAGLLSQIYNLQAICLQKTHLHDTDNIDLHGFTFVKYVFWHWPTRWVIYINSSRSIPQSCKFNQAVAVRLTLHVAVTVCSLYIPPSHNIQQRELDSLVNQLPAPFIIMDDLNGHNTLWGSNNTNNKGKHIEDVIRSSIVCF